MNWNRNYGGNRQSGGFRSRGQNGGGNYRGQGNGGYQGGGNRQNGQHEPNSGKFWPNEKKTQPNQPDFRGICNVVVNGQQVVLFVSVWENENGNFRLAFNEPSQGGGQGYSRQNSPQIRGNFQQNGHSNGRGQNGYNGNGQDWQEQPQRGSYMSRARQMPEPVYHDSPPPPDSYPEGPDGPNDEMPF